MSLAPLSMVYRSEKQLPQLFQTLKGFYRTGDFCDVVLNVGPCRISAHGVILAAFSPYLCSMLQGDLDKRRRTELSLQNIDHVGLRCLIDYCYSGVMTVDSASADKILSVAKILQVKEIEKLCVTFLTAQQNFSSELSCDPMRNYGSFSFTPPTRGSSSSTNVESSERYSPRTSPNVSTSGQPSSETGSTGHPDSDITIKVEAPENLTSDHENMNSRGRVLYVDTLDDDSVNVVDRRRVSGPGIIDMSKISPTLIASSMYPLSNMMLPTGPPSLQLMSPHQDRIRPSYHEGRPVKDRFSRGSHINTEPEEPTDLSPQATSGLVIPTLENHENLQQVLTCSVCHSMFGSAEALKMHMLLHQQTSTPPPQEARSQHINQKKEKEVHSKKFHHTENLNQDVKQENGSGSGFFRCSTCGKAFRDAQSLKFHRYNHVLRHSCNLCGKRFSRSWNLHRHRKTHFRMSGWPFRGSTNMNETLGSGGSDTDPSMSSDTMDLSGSYEEPEPEPEPGSSVADEEDQEAVDREEDNVVELLSGDATDCQKLPV